MEESVTILRIPEGAYGVNTYLVFGAETQEAVIIDPAGHGAGVVAAVENHRVDVRLILNTHGHADHVEANDRLKDKYGVPVCMHAADDAFFADAENRKRMERELGLPGPEPADRLLTDGERLLVGKMEIRVLHTPGHTPGSVCYLVGGNLFTGDTLFVGDAGRTDLAGGCLKTLIRSIETRILPLPATTVIRPGHDYGDTPTSTLEREIRENPYITDFILT